VAPGDTKGLAAKIAEILTDPARQARMSRRNLAKAQEYHNDTLRQRRRQFYRYVRDYTWQCREKYVSR